MPLCSRRTSLSCATVFAVLCCCAPTTTLAQPAASNLPTSGDATGRLFAPPDFGHNKPFLASERNNVELPVSMAGFSAVALRDHQEWLPGSRQNQLVFDGQIYWFGGQRDQDIFAAAPQQYSPVLGGDCVVTYVNTGERAVGNIEYGLIHSRRIYFFAGADEREQFRNEAHRFANGDLAHKGKCLVSHVDQQQDVTGLPETVAVVNGLRYHFAGAYQRGLFAANMGRYGVRRELLHAKNSRPVHSLTPRTTDAGSEDQQAKAAKQKRATPLSKKLNEEADDHYYVLEGYCPVTIQEQGVWIRGNYQNLVKHEDRKYLLAGENEKKMFLEDPERYAPALGGDCIVSLTDDGKLVAGGVYHSLILEGKLYLFSGSEQKQTFRDDPSKYVKPRAAGDEAPAESEAPTGQEASADQQEG
jgi:YHS domain-containing protein